MDRDAAKSLAVEALSFLAKDFERLGRFLALTGVDPKDIRALARESELQAGLVGKPNQIAAVVAGMSGEQPVFVDPGNETAS